MAKQDRTKEQKIKQYKEGKKRLDERGGLFSQLLAGLFGLGKYGHPK